MKQRGCTHPTRFSPLVLLLIGAAVVFLSSSSSSSSAPSPGARSSNNTDGCLPDQVEALADIKRICEPWPWRDITEDTIASRCVPCDPGLVGVVCDKGHGNVIALHMSNFQMTGYIPASLSSMTSLQILDFSYNYISGSIPSIIPLSITELYLGGNKLTGTIPDMVWHQNRSLISLGGNSLDGSLPDSVAEMHTLRELWLQSNELDGTIPSSIFNLTNLLVFSAGNNHLTGSLPGLFNSSLIYLDLESNDLSGPLSFSLFASPIQMLYLQENDFCGALPDVSRLLPRIIDMEVNDNNLDGPLPSFLGECSHLTLLVTANNHFTGSIPSSFSALTGIVYLDLGGNELTGSIPNFISNFTSLGYLSLANNFFSGSFPSWITSLSLLTILDLSRNSLTNDIPVTIGALTLLKTLDLSHNQLSGSIPHSIYSLYYLSHLSLEFNSLKGTISPDVKNFGILAELMLGHNQLTGIIPSTIGRLAALKKLSLTYNHLTGSAPPELANTILLDLSYNYLTGTLPPSFANIPTCFSAYNCLQPSSFCYSYSSREDCSCTETTGMCDDSNSCTDDNCSYITVANASFVSCKNSNNDTNTCDDGSTLTESFCFAGTCMSENEGTLAEVQTLCDMYNSMTPLNWSTPCFFRVPCQEPLLGISCNPDTYRVTSIEISGQIQNGSIPESISNFDSITLLDLSHNGLSGTIPQGLFYLLNLRYLILEDNDLEGTISDTITLLTFLLQMNLDNNKLYGTIPRGMRTLTRVISISLANNELTGTIPSEILSLDSLMHLNISNNALYGLFISSLPDTECSVSQNCLNCTNNTCGCQTLRKDEICDCIKPPFPYTEAPSHCWIGDTCYDDGEWEDCDLICRAEKYDVMSWFRDDCPLPLDIIIGVGAAFGVVVISGLVLFICVLRRIKVRAESDIQLSKLCLYDQDLDLSNLKGVTMSEFPLEVDPEEEVSFNLSGHQAPVGTPITDHIKITNTSSSLVKYRLAVPKSYKYTMQFTTIEDTLGSDAERDIDISLTVQCTTVVETDILVIATELKTNQEIFIALRINLESKLSTRIDHEQLQMDSSPIGEGSFGIVYKGHWRGQEVAVKVVKNQQGAKATSEFENEVQIMESLRCPQIINFVGAVHAPGHLALVTEFMPYGTLSSCLKKYPFSTMLRINCLLDCCRGMDFLHQSNILHRDLKAENLLVATLDVSASVNCKITDFGTTRDIDATRLEQHFTTGIGTPAYMAPEILQNGQYQTPADVYSFAIVAHFVVTGQEPWANVTSLWKITEAVIAGDRLPMDGIDESFAEVITTCWHQTPEKRPSFSDLCRALETLKEHVKTAKTDE